MKIFLLILILFTTTNICLAQEKQSKTKTSKKKEGVKPKKQKKKQKEKIEDVESKEVPKQNIIKNKPIYRNGKVISGSISTMQGYRVCIYYGGSREEAMQIKQTYMKSSNKMQSYLTYIRPYYKVNIGDYENKKEATCVMKRLQQTYPNAYLVPDIVTVKNIVIERGRK